jgi:adenylate cyclase
MMAAFAPGPAVLAACRWSRALLAPACRPHGGLHAGPVLFQEGDYYARAVNVAARIADYARPGEVLVTQEVVDASRSARLGRCHP